MKEADKTASANTQIIGGWGEHYMGFIHGAEWADAHPDIDVRTMAAWRGGYNEAIEKACEWLRTNLCEHYADEPIAHKMGRPISGYISFFEEPPVAVIGDFLKAMKGGEE